jgi:hypothetical protein
VALPGRGGRAPPELRGRAAAGGGAGARGRAARWKGRGGRWRAVEEDSVSDREIGEEDDARFYSGARRPLDSAPYLMASRNGSKSLLLYKTIV